MDVSVYIGSESELICYLNFLKANSIVIETYKQPQPDPG